jgi:DamX protein
MSESVTPTSEPAYITKLALSAAPFNNKVEAALYFGGGQAGHRLNLLLHLVRASDKVANLVAKQGYGKSTLLNQFQQRTGDEIRLCVVDAKQHVDIATILGQCLVSLGVSGDEARSTDDPLSVFKTRLAQLQRLSITPVIVIDNAELLSESLRSELEVWLGWQESNHFLLQAIIASATPFSLLDTGQSRLQIVTLPALSEMELPAYLLHRLNCVAYRGESPFVDKDIKRIFQQSSGCPAVVNQLAHQQLLGIKPVKATSDILANPIVLLLRRWTGLAIVVLALMSLLIFQDRVNSWLTAASDKPEIDDSTVIIEAEEALPTVVTAEQAQRDELADLIADIPSSDHVDELQGLESIIKPVAGAIQKQNRPAAVMVATQTQTAPTFLKQDWVMQQAASHYTFQLMGSWDREEVDDFIEQYALVGNVAVFESMRNGRIWHVLIYGSFANKKAALKASNEWPAPLNTLPSWLRRLDSVQKQIKNKAVIE